MSRTENVECSDLVGDKLSVQVEGLQDRQLVVLMLKICE